MLTVMKASNKCIKGIITILKVKSNKELTNYINLVCLVLNWSMFLSSFMSINLKLTNIPLNKRKQISLYLSARDQRRFLNEKFVIIILEGKN